MTKNRTTGFETSPLITMEQLRGNPVTAFETLPDWVVRMEHVFGEVHLVIDGNFYKFSRESAAVLLELGRVGFRPEPNSNGVEPNPTAYLKIIPPDAFKDTVVFLRVIMDAGHGEGVRPDWRPGDHNPENIAREPHARAKRSAREIAVDHAYRAAVRRHAAGRLPEGVNISDFMANLWALLAACDSARRGSTTTDHEGA